MLAEKKKLPIFAESYKANKISITGIKWLTQKSGTATLFSYSSLRIGRKYSILNEESDLLGRPLLFAEEMSL